MGKLFTNLKKRVAILTVLCMVLTLAPSPAFAATASDISGHWAEGTIQSWVDNGLIKGYPDGTFKPDNNITRAEFITLVNRAFEYTKTAPISFTDVNQNAWYASAIGVAVEAGYISGYPDGTMKPENPISREEAATIIMRIKNLVANPAAVSVYTDASSITWGKGEVGAVTAAKIMQGYPDGSFMPRGLITRAETVIALDNAMHYTVPADDVIPPVVDGGSHSHDTIAPTAEFSAPTYNDTDKTLTIFGTLSEAATATVFDVVFEDADGIAIEGVDTSLLGHFAPGFAYDETWDNATLVDGVLVSGVDTADLAVLATGAETVVVTFTFKDVAGNTKDADFTWNMGDITAPTATFGTPAYDSGTQTLTIFGTLSEEATATVKDVIFKDAADAVITGVDKTLLGHFAPGFAYDEVWTNDMLTTGVTVAGVNIADLATLAPGVRTVVVTFTFKDAAGITKDADFTWVIPAPTATFGTPVYDSVAKTLTIIGTLSEDATATVKGVIFEDADGIAITSVDTAKLGHFAPDFAYDEVWTNDMLTTGVTVAGVNIADLATLAPGAETVVVTFTFKDTAGITKDADFTWVIPAPTATFGTPAYDSGTQTLTIFGTLSEEATATVKDVIFKDAADAVITEVDKTLLGHFAPGFAYDEVWTNDMLTTGVTVAGVNIADLATLAPGVRTVVVTFTFKDAAGITKDADFTWAVSYTHLTLPTKRIV